MRKTRVTNVTSYDELRIRFISPFPVVTRNSLWHSSSVAPGPEPVAPVGDSDGASQHISRRCLCDFSPIQSHSLMFLPASPMLSLHFLHDPFFQFRFLSHSFHSQPLEELTTSLAESRLPHSKWDENRSLTRWLHDDSHPTLSICIFNWEEEAFVFTKPRGFRKGTVPYCAILFLHFFVQSCAVGVGNMSRGDDGPSAVLRADWGEPVTDAWRLVTPKVSVTSPWHIHTPRPSKKGEVEWPVQGLANRTGIWKGSKVFVCFNSFSLYSNL